METTSDKHEESFAETALKLGDLATQLGFRNADALFEVVGKDGETGLLVPSDDPDTAAAEALAAEATAAAPAEAAAEPAMVEVWRPGGRHEERRPRHERHVLADLHATGNAHRQPHLLHERHQQQYAFRHDQDLHRMLVQEQERQLPPLAEGDRLSAREIEAHGHETQPPARFTVQPCLTRVATTASR